MWWSNIRPHASSLEMALTNVLRVCFRRGKKGSLFYNKTDGESKIGIPGAKNGKLSALMRVVEDDTTMGVLLHRLPCSNTQLV